MSRQQRRAEERRESKRAQFDRIHGQVLAGLTIRDMWLTYGRERFEKVGMNLDDPEVTGTVKHSFYAGAAAMFELLQRVSPDDISEETGVEMLSRLQEELDTYARGLR